MDITKENSPSPNSYNNFQPKRIIGCGKMPKGKYERINFT